MKRLILNPVGLLAVIFSLMLVSNASAQDLTSAIQLTRSEQYDKAETILKDLINKEPSNSKYYFYLRRITCSIILQIQYQTPWQLQPKLHRKYTEGRQCQSG